jgi:non-ribosomal peptide synthetase component F
VGEQGDLCVSNPCLARGYLNRSDLTAEKVIPNPFNDGFSPRLYRTGDMPVQCEDGTIEFRGRGDHQIVYPEYAKDVAEKLSKCLQRLAANVDVLFSE